MACFRLLSRKRKVAVGSSLPPTELRLYRAGAQRTFSLFAPHPLIPFPSLPSPLLPIVQIPMQFPANQHVNRTSQAAGLLANYRKSFCSTAQRPRRGQKGGRGCEGAGVQLTGWEGAWGRECGSSLEGLGRRAAVDGEASGPNSPVVMEWCPKPQRENRGLMRKVLGEETTAWSRRGTSEDGETNFPQSSVFGNGDGTQASLVQQSPAGPCEYLEALVYMARTRVSTPSLGPRGSLGAQGERV